MWWITANKENSTINVTDRLDTKMEGVDHTKIPLPATIERSPAPNQNIASDHVDPTISNSWS